MTNNLNLFGTDVCFAKGERGQYRLFVTTSYYTRQSQQEVLEDGYPAKLLAGNDTVLFLRELRLVSGE